MKRRPQGPLPRSAFMQHMRYMEEKGDISALRDAVESALAGLCNINLSVDAQWIVEALDVLRADWNGKPRWSWVYPSWDVVLQIVQIDEELLGWFEEIVAANPKLTFGEAKSRAHEARLLAHGGDRRSEKAKDQGVNHTLIRGTGNRDYTLARLDRDRPDLASKVRAKELSAHAAAIEAGFRKKPTPLETVRKVWRGASPEDRRRIAAFVAGAMNLEGDR